MSLLVGTKRVFLLAGSVSGYPVTPTNNIVAAVGDSIAIASGNTGGADYDSNYAFRTLNTSGSLGGFLSWACLLPKTGQTASDGRMQWGGAYGTGGLNIANVVTTHISGADSPINATPKPGIAAWMPGANDSANFTSGGVAQTAAITSAIASVRTGCNALIAAGILPCLCTLTPRSTSTLDVGIQAFNTALIALAAELRVPYANFYAATASAGVWIANYNAAGTDADHPSGLGAKAMGQTLRDALDTVLPATSPTDALVTNATRAAAGIVFLNGDFSADGNADNIPDGGYTAVSTGYFSATANGATPTLATRTGYDNKAWRINKTSDAGDTQYLGTGAGGTFSPVLTDGHLYEIGFTFEIASWSDTETYFLVQLQKITDGGKVPFAVTVRKDQFVSTAVAQAKLIHRFRCSDAGGGAGIAPSGGYRWNILAGGSQPTNLIDVYLGQLTLRDLGVG